MTMKNNKDSLGDRMKNNYENRAKTYLVRRMPVIIRLQPLTDELSTPLQRDLRDLMMRFSTML